MNTYQFIKNVEIKDSYDVIVCGGGVAGCAAAYTSARNGYKTLLLEKSTILGGLATLGLINLFVPMCNGRGRQIIFGLCEKWTRMSAELGFDTIPKSWKEGEPKEPTKERYIQRFSPNIFALQLMSELSSVGVDILYDCVATEPIMEGKTVTGVITTSKSGLLAYSCKVVIDTTGDADIVRQSGTPFAEGENYFTYSAKCVTLAGCRKAAETENICNMYSGIAGGGINLYGHNQPDDIPKWAGTSVEDVNDYLQRNQKLMLSKLKAEDKNSRDIVMLPGMPQFRTTCHIVGEHTFRHTDAYRHFDDSIAAINDFDRRDYLYEVPYGTLYNKDYPNILAAGRCACAEGYGWDVLRVIPPAIITGQAAGEAACIAIADGVSVHEVDVKKLQRKLEAENVMIHFPDELIPQTADSGESAEIDGGHI